ncbi:protein of unknown function [Shewanella benthica]|uniref:Uncharacterized protein n=1 Tax=Shewanella benthica TaxID=43661 RepID=A0A330M5Y3_9GAMM|nr:protein of unknown function [Shewanella benthica]
MAAGRSVSVAFHRSPSYMLSFSFLHSNLPKYSAFKSAKLTLAIRKGYISRVS